MISHETISFPPPSSTSSINGFVQDPNNFPNPNPNPNPNLDSNTVSGNKRKRSLPGNPDPEAEVIALSPKSLMATNRFICEVCNKGFQREQNLQLHRRGHNLPWKLKQKANKEQVKKKVYVCPEKSCVHNDPSRALGDLTGIKKHFSRKHGEKKWKCDKCSKKYAVMSDWKAHSKICGTREYKCDCGTIFSRKDSFITHRAFCDALTEERMRVSTNINPSSMNPNFRADLMNGSLISTPQSMAGISPFSTTHRPDFIGFDTSSSNGNNNINVDGLNKPRLPLWLDHHQHQHQHHNHHQGNPQVMSNHIDLGNHGLPEFASANLNLLSSTPSQEGMPKEETDKSSYPQSLISLYSSQPHPQSSFPGSMSATALLQKAAQMGSTRSDNSSTVFASALGAMRSSNSSSTQSNLSNNLANYHNNQLAMEHGYSGANQMMMMGTTLNDHNNNNNNKINTSGGMRDFLGTLGGASGNNNVNERNGGGGERRVLMQEEIAYKLATMGGSSHHDQHQQEPYMDLMR